MGARPGTLQLVYWSWGVGGTKAGSAKADGIETGNVRAGVAVCGAELGHCEAVAFNMGSAAVLWSWTAEAGALLLQANGS